MGSRRVEFSDIECKTLLNEIVRQTVDEDEINVKILIDIYRESQNYKDYEQSLIDETTDTIDKEYACENVS